MHERAKLIYSHTLHSLCPCFSYYATHSSHHSFHRRHRQRRNHHRLNVFTPTHTLSFSLLTHVLITIFTHPCTHQLKHSLFISFVAPRTRQMSLRLWRRTLALHTRRQFRTPSCRGWKLLEPNVAPPESAFQSKVSSASRASPSPIVVVSLSTVVPFASAF